MHDRREIYAELRKVMGYIVAFVALHGILHAQNTEGIQFTEAVTLEECIQYALQHNPALKNANLQETYVEAALKSKLAEWYPQVGLSYNLQHNFKLPSTDFNDNIIRIGSENTSGINLSATQTVFNRDILLASKSAEDTRMSAEQQTIALKIDITVAVSKAFYNVILIGLQEKVIDEDIKRNTQSVNDAYAQYQSGIVDKTDYMRATIALNNAQSQKVFISEKLKAARVYLNELMGYSGAEEIQLAFDAEAMKNALYVDTLQPVDYAQRIEIRLLETQKRLQQANLKYQKWSFLPEIHVFGSYNMNYLSDEFSELYTAVYPNSNIGIGLTYPIFQGGKRVHALKGMQLLLEQTDNEIAGYQQTVNTQYQAALSAYKSNMYHLSSLEKNMELAQEVYDIIQLQYRSGVKAFLDVITAETDLRTAQINYYNALYEVLSSKLDVEQALGTIKY